MWHRLPQAILPHMMWTTCAQANYYSIMRTLTVIMLSVLVLLASCQSSEETDFSSIDESQAQLILLHSAKNALMTTENEAFQDLETLELPASYSTYTSQLRQFSIALDGYLEAIRLALHSALGEITDLLLAGLETKDLSQDVYGYFTRGYSSVGEELMDENADAVLEILHSHLEQHAEDIDAMYSLMDREARIWRDNQANLALVGQGRQLPSIEPIGSDELSQWAFDTYFDTLARNEVVQRSRMIVEGVGT